jgi:predicted NBD/HSP70 family sugar kinase
MTIVQNGELCTCGQRGCFEAYCSTLALERKSGVTLDEFFTGLDNGIEKYADIREEFLQNLVTGLNNLIVLTNSKVVIGGSMSPYLRKHASVISQRLSDRSPFGEARVIISNLGEYGPAIGAALTQVDKFLSFD